MIGIFEVFFTIAVAITAFVSLEDIKHEKISNKAILLLFSLGFIYLLLEPSTMLSAFIIFIYSFFVSFMIWFLGLWPAGDAKLFAALSLFFPRHLFASNIVVFNFMANAFVPIFFFMFFVIIAKSNYSALKEALKFTFDPYKLFMLSVMLIGFIWFIQQGIQILTFAFTVQFDYFITMILLFIVFEVFRRTLSSKMEFFFIGCAVLRVLIDPQTVYSLSFFEWVLKILLIFLFFRFFILHLAFKLYTEKVPIEKLKPGMNPGELIKKTGEHFEREESLNISLINVMMQKSAPVIHSLDSLTKEDVAKIKKLRRDGKIPFKEMIICKMQPFAAFILLGYILTVLFETNLVNYAFLALAFL